MPTDKRAVAAAAKQSVLTVLGKRLRDARKRTRYSQLAAAEHIKVTGQTIRNWETGRNEPPMTAIRQLAALYGTTEATLLEDLFDPLLPPQPRHRRFRYGRIAVDSAELSQARRDAGLTQEQVADMTGVHIGAIRRYERGRSNPPVGTLQILASIYGRQAASSPLPAASAQRSRRPWRLRPPSISPSAPPRTRSSRSTPQPRPT